jgi:L-alanine-DL-glutamate epimerase-like enolase superfamily enzyme
MHAIDLANALAEFEPYWFEEPRQTGNVEALVELRTKGRRRPEIDILVTGEQIAARMRCRLLCSRHLSPR